MTTEAFDPFANDEDIDDDNVFQLNTTMKISNRNHRNSNPTRRTSPPTQTSQSINGNGVNHITDEVMKEFNYAFPSMSLNGNDDDGDDHAFGFTSHFFPKEYTSTTTTAATTADVNTNNISSPAATTTPLTLVIAEEMSVIHKSSSNQCSVTVRGIISLEGGTTSNYSGDISIRDPHRQLLNGIAISNNNEGTNRNNVSTRIDAFDPNSFRLNYTSENNMKSDDHPILEYTCGESVRPVPMLITTTIQELTNGANHQHHHQMLFTLRVNPRNTHSLLNAVVLVHVPLHIDGARAQVSSVGRSIGRGNIDSTQWNEMTRILSWKLGELYSGAVCEFEAIFPPMESTTTASGGGGDEAEPILAQEEDGKTSYAMFPVLLRYECEGSLLSDVDLECSGWMRGSNGSGSNNAPPPIVKRKFRVYHREV